MGRGLSISMYTFNILDKRMNFRQDLHVEGAREPKKERKREREREFGYAIRDLRMCIGKWGGDGGEERGSSREVGEEGSSTCKVCLFVSTEWPALEWGPLVPTRGY